MSLPTPLPSPYEISRLAVALRGCKAAKQPIEAVREALGLWFVAAIELETVKEGKNLFDGLEACPLGDATDRYWAKFEKEVADWVVVPPYSDRSEAMKRLAEKGVVFKTRSAFLKAWKEIFGEPASTEISPYTPAKLDMFLQKRIEKKRSKDAERKREKRKPNEAGQEPVK